MTDLNDFFYKRGIKKGGPDKSDASTDREDFIFDREIKKPPVSYYVPQFALLEDDGITFLMTDDYKFLFKELGDIIAPLLVSATISATGNSITFLFDEVVQFGPGGSGGWLLTMSGGPVLLSYTSGEGSTALVYSLNRVIMFDETGTVAYSQAGDGIEDLSGNDLASFAGAAVINNSTERPFIVYWSLGMPIIPSFSGAWEFSLGMPNEYPET